MKKLLILLIAITLFSCKEEAKPTYVVFNGTVENSPSKTVKLFGNGLDADLSIADNGTFGDTLTIEKNGYYTLRVGRESTPIYLVQGVDVGVTLNAKEFDESLVYTGKGASENNYLAAKYLLSEKEMAFDKVYSLTEGDFIEEANKINSSYTDLLASSVEISKDFISIESKELEYAHINNLENYQEYHGYFTKNNEFKVSESYYDPFKEYSFNDAEIFENSDAYRRLAGTHYGRLAGEKAETESLNVAIAYLEIVNANFDDGNAKDDLMFSYLRYGMKPDESLTEVYNIYKNSNPTADNLAKVTDNFNVLKVLTPGNVSPTFNYENHKGGETSLADLKGKVVYVDVWATWCGPCKREIPFLKEVEEEYHNENVAFVSISIDVEKDYEAWRTMVSEKELGGIQLMADKDWKSKFVTGFEIRGIPRFILIGPDGNIIDASAPRPSSESLIKLFDEHNI